MERDKGKARRIYPHESGKLMKIKICHRFVEGTERFVCAPSQSMEGSEMKPVTKHAQLLYSKEGI